MFSSRLQPITPSPTIPKSYLITSINNMLGDKIREIPFGYGEAAGLWRKYIFGAHRRPAGTGHTFFEKKTFLTLDSPPTASNGRSGSGYLEKAALVIGSQG